jgi:aryl-alcohol dehydrogenase-like predicted oxidoreductase
MGEGPNEGRLSALHIRPRRATRACDGLGTDRIDLYQMHHIDRDTPLDEIWQAMEVLVQQGKVIYVGSSNFAGWHLARACESAGAPGLPRPRLRAEQVQPRRARDRARGDPGLPGLRPRPHPL